MIQNRNTGAIKILQTQKGTFINNVVSGIIKLIESNI